MKIKELQKVVNIAWSPNQQHPILLAAGTAAQQFDAGANSVLEIYSANLLDPGYDLELKVSQPSSFRFQKVIWSPAGIGQTHPNGLIIGGCESGHLEVYSASKMLAGEPGLVANQDKHKGAIGGLDFNPFQNNLLASAASESEIYIWDLNNISTPMSPGTKTPPFEDVQNIAWNRQVQHILASVFSTRCVIWDLRKNDQIMKLIDTQSRVRWRAIQWNPEVATQLWLASEDDQAPYVQLWDLRYATAPSKTMLIHQRGILGMTWCPKDSDLMITCGKDNKIYCWNPNTSQQQGEILGEVATTLQWYSDVQWCPRNPALIASSSLEGNVSVYSLFGGTHQQVQTSNKIADSFPGMDQITEAPNPQQTIQITYADLKSAPKWMRPKSRVSFGFGGRLLSFNEKSARVVTIHQVITEQDLVQRANNLEKALEEGNFSEYCRMKADQMTDQHGRHLWYFIKANFELNPREEMLNLLGYNKEDIANKFEKFIKHENNIVNLANKISTLNHSDSEVDGDQSTDDSTDLSGTDNTLFDTLAADNKINQDKEDETVKNYKISVKEDTEGLTTEAILTGNIEAAVELCMENGKPAEALIIASTGGIDFLTSIQTRYLKKQNTNLSQIISGLIGRNWFDVVSNCAIDSWKEALVAILTHSDSQITDICVKLGERIIADSNDINISRNALLCYICAGSLEKLVEGWLKLRNTDNSKLNTSELQELIEIVMLVRKSLEVRGQHIEATGKVAEFMSQYAGLLAAQGALDTALSYLGPTDDPELEDLRERLYFALGHKQQQRFSQSSQQSSFGRQQQSTTKRYSQPRTSFSNAYPNSTANTANPRQSLPSLLPPTHPWTPNSAVPQHPNPTSFNQSWNATSSQQPYVPPSVSKPPTVNDNVNHPPRPASVGSQGSTGNTLSSRKYVVDPSVNTGTNYGSAMFNPMQPTNSFNNTMQQTNFPAPNQFTSNSLGGYPTQTPSVMSTAPNQNFQPFASANNFVSGGIIPGIPPIETGQQVMPPPLLPSANRNPTPPPGWNDPPPLSSTRNQVYYNGHKEMSAKHAGTKKWQKIINSHNNYINENSSTLVKKSSNSPQDNSLLQNKTKNDVSSRVNPITHPIFGASTYDANQNPNGYMDPSSNTNMMQNQSYQTPPMQNHIFQPTPQAMQNPLMQQNDHNQYSQSRSSTNSSLGGFKTEAVSNASHIYDNMNQQQHYSNVIPPSKKPEPLLEKLPLPEEYIYMQTVFEELKTQCMESAQDARTKRKIGDISKRLECLYDALREKRLSQNTTNLLNQIVQHLQTGDYGNALITHTAIISGVDFAQTANFMPGIKILVQTAAELKIYLR